MPSDSRLERRLAALEQAYASEAMGPGGGGDGHGERRRFLSAVLRACGHVRRQPVDSPPWRYEVGKLKDLEPLELGAYVATLRMLEHPDEPEARKLLDSDARLERLIDLATSLKASHS
jgi:hypothetical protein